MTNKNIYARRDFIRMASILMGSTQFNLSEIPGLKAKRKLAFSTIGCPDWSFDQMVKFAKAHGYSGIEFRGIQRELDLTKVKAFLTPADISDSKAKMHDHALEFVALAASTRLHVKAPADRAKELDEAKRFIDLAAKVNCPYVRVFPDKLPKDEEKQETLDRISKGLLELADYAKGTAVKVLLESHGDVVYIRDLLYILKAAEHPSTGFLYDFFNMWIVTGESPKDAYKQLSPYIRHIQIKDGDKIDTGFHLTLLGQGNSPLIEAMQALEYGGYKGFYSLEWEKLWHPDLPDPEIAFPQYATFMKKSINQLRKQSNL